MNNATNKHLIEPNLYCTLFFT